MLSLESFREISEQIQKDCYKPFSPIVIQTGLIGSLYIDFVIRGLYCNITQYKKGKYRATINLFKKEGLYKAHMTKNHIFVFCKGTKIIKEITRQELFKTIKEYEKKIFGKN